MPSISITTPTSGSTVMRMFPVGGTYTASSPPTISVELRDANGTTVATTVGIAAAGSWSGIINSPGAYTGASVHAEIVGTTANDTVGNITVS